GGEPAVSQGPEAAAAAAAARTGGGERGRAEATKGEDSDSRQGVTTAVSERLSRRRRTSDNRITSGVGLRGDDLGGGGGGDSGGGSSGENRSRATSADVVAAALKVALAAKRDGDASGSGGSRG
ncbi:unnamed protein product, partial [Scytosiphon promiscuus]